MIAKGIQPIAILLLPLICLGGCGDHEFESGPTVEERRDVEAFSEISLRGSARLEVHVGSGPSVEVSGSERAVKALKTEVFGDTLRIRTDQHGGWVIGGRSRVVVKVAVPTLTALDVSGGNDVRLSGFDGGKTTIEVEGAANLKAKGRLDSVTVKMAGAGHADLRDLVAGEAKVTVDGVGSVYVHATESLDATMNGVGAILYSGSPRRVNTSMNGVGTISRDRERRSNDDEPASERDDASELEMKIEV
ncbi:MAG TPA: DUF2807 domain-containing protein [Steroidobacteraceae bacterium]